MNTDIHKNKTYPLLIFIFPILFIVSQGCNAQQNQAKEEVKHQKSALMNKSDKEWKQILTPLQYNVLRQAGTERPFTGEYESLFEKGMYVCAACGNELFESSTKYHSGCGWPSFFDVKSNQNVTLHKDTSYGMIRTEIRCAKCGSHLGHVFNDGPPPTGLRYCINSAALKFIPSGKKK